MKTALIVDTDESAIIIAADEARRAGFETHQSSSGQDAIQLAQSIHPQLFVIEIKLADALGYEVTRAIRKHPGLYHAAVLLTSNASEPPDIEYALQEGADSFLKKPFTAEDVFSRVQAMVRLREQVHERCATTGMGSVLGLRREIDHLIFRQEDFALCYVIPKGLSRFRQNHEEDRIQRAATTAAEVIRTTIHNEGFYETYCCHMGSGHFMVKVCLDDWKRFFKSLVGRFAAAHAQSKNNAALPSDEMRFGVVLNREGFRYRHSRDMFNDARGARTTHQGDTPIDKSSRIRKPAKKPGHEHWAG